MAVVLVFVHIEEIALSKCRHIFAPSKKAGKVDPQENRKADFEDKKNIGQKPKVSEHRQKAKVQ